MTHKKVRWYEETDMLGHPITYATEEYPGASAYTYKWEHLPSGKFGYKIIYGVSKEQGDELVKVWNTRLSSVWRYSTLNQ